MFALLRNVNVDAIDLSPQIQRPACSWNVSIASRGMLLVSADGLTHSTTGLQMALYAASIKGRVLPLEQIDSDASLHDVRIRDRSSSRLGRVN